MKTPPQALPEERRLSDTRLAVAVQILETETDPSRGFKETEAPLLLQREKSLSGTIHQPSREEGY